MSDLIERLNKEANAWCVPSINHTAIMLALPPISKLLREAAAELATLRAEVARLNRLGHERDGNFLDPIGCCKVCDGEIPDGHMDTCDIWKLEAALAAAQKDADNWRKLWCENSSRLTQSGGNRSDSPSTTEPPS